jgi:membrane protein YqaA with SNARE-associated domain
LLPLGSEPAVFGLTKLNPDLFWAAIGVATTGNTLGGMVSWWMGYGTHQAVDLVRKRQSAQESNPSSMSDKMHSRALQWLQQMAKI